MVRYIRDATGRFSERPYYDEQELDQECEHLIVNFLYELHEEVRFPVDTEDLKKLIERDADDLDCYADLSAYGSDVEGLTEFKPDQKPVVKIASFLTEDDRRENRLRTTLTHEYGHVHLHASLYTANQTQGHLFALDNSRRICHRHTMLDAPNTDWMEWQAGYVCGALLMPSSYLARLVGEFLAERRHFGPIRPNSPNASDLIDWVVDTFHVSREAARIRLLKRNYFGSEHGRSLFT